MFDTSVFCLLQVTPPTTIPKIREKNHGPPKVPEKRKQMISSEALRKQSQAGKIQKTLNYGIS